MADYQAENDALLNLFNRMNTQKTQQAQRLDYAHQAGLDIDKKSDTPLPAPTAPNPIHSDYLEQKRREDAERQRAERQQREAIQRQLEDEKEQLSRMNRQLQGNAPQKEEPHPTQASASKQPAKPSASTTSKPATPESPAKPRPKGKPNAFGVSPAQPHSAKENPPKRDTAVPVTPSPTSAPAQETQKPVLDNIEPVTATKAESASLKPAPAPKPQPEKKVPVKPADTQQAKPADSTTSHVSDSDIKAALGAIFGKKSDTSKVPRPTSTPAEAATRPFQQKAKAPAGSNRSIAVRPNGMAMTATGSKDEKLSITGIIPMKTDNGSIYDSAVKPSNAFRANVFLDCSYNEKDNAGCYGLVVDMGTKKMIQGTSGQTSDEWEYGFLGIIHAIRICRENNVKEVMFIIREPLCEVIQQNTEGLIWGYSLTRKEFYNEFQRSKGEFATGFYSGDLNNEGLQQYQDLAETISRTLIFPPQDSQ